ncbi:MAG: hypothetical protein LBT09_04345 [Planctomycetaceae bacterium]|jgi:hypothetical protein|nr:hypothetical protein [Planctomycetaceae bacterium]
MFRFVNYIFNPLLIRELRQFVRNKFVIVLINIYVLANVAACLFELTMGVFGASEIMHGKNLFSALVHIVSITGIMTIVLRTVWTTATDRVNEDLMFYASMSPSMIVVGKIISGVIFTLLLMSITLPFVTLAYMLRGIDLEVVFVAMFEIFVVLQVLNSFAIFLASLNKLKIFIYISTFIVFGVSFFVYCCLVGGTFALIYRNILQEKMGWEGLCVLSFLECIFFALFICGSIAMFSPPTSNRMFPLRVLLTIIFLSSILVAFFDVFDFYWSSKDVFQGIEIVGVFGLPFLILFISCERDQWSTRIRRSLPKSLILRILLFPFYTGAACGIVWFFMVVLAIYFIDISVADLKLFQTTTHNGDTAIKWGFGVLMFSFDYSVTAMLIRSRYFKKLDTRYVLLIALFLLLLFTLGSMLIYFFIMILVSGPNGTSANPLHDYGSNLVSALNPFCDSDNNVFTLPRVIGMTYWFFLLLIPLAAWYRNRLGNFNPNVKESITYDEAREIIKNTELQTKDKRKN